MSNITSFVQCVSQEERKRRGLVTLVNVIIWIAIVIGVFASMGIILLFVGLSLLLRYLLSEYMVRKLQAMGATVSEKQFPVVHEAAQQVYQCFHVRKPIHIIVIASGEMNALALGIARKRVIVLLSSLLDGVIDSPEELRALIGHESCHVELDMGWRGFFEIYRPAPFRQARELTCDNAGLVAAGNLTAAKQLVKKLCVGRFLFDRISEPALIEESHYIYSGLIGWFIRQYLTHPPAGARLENIAMFASEQQLPINTPSLLS